MTHPHCIRWRRRAALAALPYAALLCAAPASAAERVVSTSLCGDAYVLALVEAEDVAALSWQVDHPVSTAPAWARAKPKAWASVERLAALKPDVVVFGPGEGARAGPWMARIGARGVEVPWAEDFAGVRAALRDVGGALDADARAEALIADLDARLAALGSGADDPPTALYLNTGAATAGAGTFVDAALAAAGARNMAAEDGLTGWGRAPAEAVLRERPDILVTSFFENGYAGILNFAPRHAVYARLLKETPRVEVPGGDLFCAGPKLIDVAERIADALESPR